ncbi:hypothetical protein [Flammeovirga aprica]|uniref:Uncharacterized protein n=1 Tax=Flammeovirga aprica JL-4 TaxID=694437 RepID=A0A7X9X9S5_9BACT|nr:hypothetical protein [Flammeovirga aprica]NME69055.1 hypothetical protein [Flammeovirga aprica JL-4]
MKNLFVLIFLLLNIENEIVVTEYISKSNEIFKIEKKCLFMKENGIYKYYYKSDTLTVTYNSNYLLIQSLDEINKYVLEEDINLLLDNSTEKILIFKTDKIENIDRNVKVVFSERYGIIMISNSSWNTHIMYNEDDEVVNTIQKFILINKN